MIYKTLITIVVCLLLSTVGATSSYSFSPYLQVGTHHNKYGNAFVINDKGCAITAAHILTDLSDLDRIAVRTRKQVVIRYSLVFDSVGNDIAVICPYDPLESPTKYLILHSPEDLEEGQRLQVVGFSYTFYEWGTSTVYFDHFRSFVFYPHIHDNVLILVEATPHLMAPGHSGAPVVTEKGQFVVGFIVIEMDTIFKENPVWAAVSSSVVMTYLDKTDIVYHSK